MDWLKAILIGLVILIGLSDLHQIRVELEILNLKIHNMDNMNNKEDKS